MSRSDQWIGLTDTAAEFINQLRETYKEDLIETNIVLVPSSETLCGVTDFHGVQLVYNDKDLKSPNSQYIIREKIQCAPWSSGPMYFTCLEYLCVKRIDNKEVMLIPELFGWVQVIPSNFNGYTEHIDYKLGHMCV